MNVSGVLRLDVSSAVDQFSILEPRAAAMVACGQVPAGVTVELHIGAARCVLGNQMGVLLAELRPASSIVVVGTDPAGIAAVVKLLQIAFRERAAS